MGLGDKVQFLDEIDDSELIQCYQQCDVFILPNRSDGNDIEGFGMVLVEAQAAGKAVIAGDSGGTAETMKLGETGLVVDCTQPARIAEAIINLKEATDAGQFRAETCRQHIMTNLTWEKHAEQAVGEFRRWGGAG